MAWESLAKVLEICVLVAVMGILSGMSFVSPASTGLVSSQSITGQFLPIIILILIIGFLGVGIA